jgi:hypothetical protein
MIGIVTRLWVGQCGIPFVVGVRDFSLIQNVSSSSGPHVVSYSLSTRASFPRGEAGFDADHTFHVEPKLRMSGAVPLLPICSFMVYTWTALS